MSYVVDITVPSPERGAPPQHARFQIPASVLLEGDGTALLDHLAGTLETKGIGIRRALERMPHTGAALTLAVWAQ